MEIFVNDVILSYPDLWKPGPPPKDRPNEPGRYGCQGIFLPESPQHILIRDTIIAVAKVQWPETWQNIIKSLNKDKKCLRNGDDNLDAKGKQREEYKGMMYLRATNKGPVPVIAAKAKKPDGSWNLLTEKDGKPYAGCRVNLKVDIYAMDTYGNAINASLLAVQFVRDGTAFGGAPASADGFDDVPGAVDDDAPMSMESAGAAGDGLGL